MVEVYQALQIPRSGRMVGNSEVVRAERQGQAGGGVVNLTSVRLGRRLARLNQRGDLIPKGGQLTLDRRPDLLVIYGRIFVDDDVAKVDDLSGFQYAMQILRMMLLKLSHCFANDRKQPLSGSTQQTIRFVCSEVHAVGESEDVAACFQQIA